MYRKTWYNGGMKTEYDFSKGERGKFYHPNAVFNLPVYTEDTTMITKDILKQEIDQIQDEYIEVLYTVIKAFEYPIQKTHPTLSSSTGQWDAFLEKFAGSFANAPLHRGEQGTYEVREALQ